MSPVKKKRLLWVGGLVAVFALAVFFILKAFEQNMMFFFSVTEVVEGQAPAERDFRVGGMVVEGSFARIDDSLTVKFDLTDYAKVLTVSYTGVLPDLFREGQGIVALGQLDTSGVFEAKEVLAKHDENYMPPEVSKTLQVAN